MKLSDDTWNQTYYFKLLKFLTPIMEGSLFETFETSQTYHGGLLIWNFKWHLKWDVLFETFETSQTYHGGLLIWNFWNFSNLSWRVAYLKLSDHTWNQTYYFKLFKLLNLSWRVAYLKLSDEIWNGMCYLKLLKLLKPIMEGGLFETFETFQTYHGRWLIWNFSNLSWRVAYLKLLKPIMEGCLFETFRWHLKWDVLFETFETSQIYHEGWLIWNFSNLSWRVAYLKLSDETWNEMYYLKLLKLLKPIMGGCLFESFRWDLKWDVLFETFETSQTYHGGWLIWNFQMRLEMRCAIWNFWNFSNLSWKVAYLKLLKLLKPIMEGGLFETFRWHLKWDVLFETFKTSQTYHGGLLIWNFQMRLEMRCAIWNFWNFSNLSWRVAYLKLSDDTWNEMCYLKLLKLLKPIMEGGLFESFRWDLKWDVPIMKGCSF